MKVLIVGMGKLGVQLAEAFVYKGNDVTVVDQKQSALQKVSDQLDVLAIQQNGVEMSNLGKTQVSQMDLTIAVTDDDETNILICFLAKRKGCKQAIGRVRNPEYYHQIEFIKNEMDIDYIVNPDRTTAFEIRDYLLKDITLNMENFAQGQISLMDIHVHNLCSVAGKQLKDLDGMEKVRVVAVSREGKVIIPYGDLLIEDDDVLYLVGQSQDVTSFTAGCGVSTEQKQIQSVVILGGGRIAYYLARELKKAGKTVKIFENNHERCKYLAEHLDDVLIIYGDGTDLTLLGEEEAFDADALVSLTGLDEENLLFSLLAKQNGMKHVVSKVSRPNYIPIIEKLGVDAAINPVTITASEIMRYVLGGKVASLSLLLSGMAEAVEIAVQAGSYVTQDALGKLDIPRGLVVGAVLRNNTVLIPNGETKIEPGDRVVVFTLNSEMGRLEQLFYPPKKGRIRELWNNR